MISEATDDLKETVVLWISSCVPAQKSRIQGRTAIPRIWWMHTFLEVTAFSLFFLLFFFCLFRVLQIQYTLEPNLRIVKNTVTFEWSIKLMYGYYPLSFPGRPTLGKVTNMLFILVYSFYVAVHDSYFANKGFTFKQGMNSLIVCLLHTFFNHGFFFFFFTDYSVGSN